MKQKLTTLALGALLLAGCQGKTDEPALLETENYEAQLTIDGRIDGRYNLNWPKEGQLPEATVKQLLYASFGDSLTADPEAAARNWIVDVTKVDEPTPRSEQITGEASVETSIGQQGNLVYYTVNRSSSVSIAAHGFYSMMNIMIDMADGHVVTLDELVDTTDMGELLAQAVHELDTNRAVLDCLFDEYAERMPMTRNFVIDSTRSNMAFIYGLYEVASYADGIQTVVVPVRWLNSRRALTPYGKKLLGL